MEGIVMTHTLENEQLLVKIDDHGAELVEIYDKEKEQQVLWEADSAFWNRHAPVLFPNVGRYYENHCLIDGKTYESGQHGFARDKDFVCTEKNPDSITHLLKSDDSTRVSWPFDFELSITHRLEGNTLTILWKVINTDQNTMYFTIGGHPAFRVPVLSGTSRNQYHLNFYSQKKFTYCQVDMATGTVYPDKTKVLKLENGTCPITDHMFDDDALVFDGGQVEKVGINYPNGSPYIEMNCKGFPSLGIWSKSPDAPFVCLEPWMGRCDNYGYHDELSLKQDINKVEPGKTFNQSYSITVY